MGNFVYEGDDRPSEVCLGGGPVSYWMGLLEVEAEK